MKRKYKKNQKIRNETGFLLKRKQARDVNKYGHGHIIFPQPIILFHFRTGTIMSSPLSQLLYYSHRQK